MVSGTMTRTGGGQTSVKRDRQAEDKMSERDKVGLSLHRRFYVINSSVMS
jgi:hypothetical protein